MAVILVPLLQLASFVFIARAVLSWLPIRHDSPFAPVRSFVWGVTEPVLAPIRNVMPRMGGIDLSVFAVLVIISFVLTPIALRL